MTDNELAEKLLFTARGTAEWMLKQYGDLAPFGIFGNFDGEGIQTTFPRDRHPAATHSQLVDLVASELREQAGRQETGAVALVTKLESGGQTAIGIQLETRSIANFTIYPYSKGWFGWRIGRLQRANGLLVERVFVTGQA